MRTGRRNRRVRLWPLAIILIGAAGWLVWVWSFRTGNRQTQVLATMTSGVIVAGLVLLWLLLLSGLRWYTRLATLAGVAALAAAAYTSLEIRAVRGDVVPILAWRWSPKPDTTLPVPSPESPPAPEATPSAPRAGDFPQFRGPHRDGSVDGVRLARDWSAYPPRQVWRQPIGAGWSGFVVVGDLAITQEQRGQWEMVVAYDLATGAVRWTHQDLARFEHLLGGDGPRATPAVAGGRVYALGSTGILSCLDLATGDVLWSVNVLEDNGARRPQYGAASSPLLVDGLVVVVAGATDGRSLVAYDAGTGAFVWGGGDRPAGYSSPLLATLAGVRQILLFSDPQLAGHDPAGGAVLWKHPWPKGCEKVSQPVPLPGDRVFLSAGYGVGGKLFQVTADDAGGLSASPVWETTRLKAKFTNVVHRDGYLYGLDDGKLVCLDLRDGERAWRGGRHGHGQVLLVDDLLLVQAEDGEVVLVEARPEAHRELGRFQAVEGKTWAHPALAGRYYLIRNAREAACYELALEG